MITVKVSLPNGGSVIVENVTTIESLIAGLGDNFNPSNQALNFMNGLGITVNGDTPMPSELDLTVYSGRARQQFLERYPDQQVVAERINYDIMAAINVSNPKGAGNEYNIGSRDRLLSELRSFKTWAQVNKPNWFFMLVSVVLTLAENAVNAAKGNTNETSDEGVVVLLADVRFPFGTLEESNDYFSDEDDEDDSDDLLSSFENELLNPNRRN